MKIQIYILLISTILLASCNKKTHVVSKNEKTIYSLLIDEFYIQPEDSSLTENMVNLVVLLDKAEFIYSDQPSDQYLRLYSGDKTKSEYIDLLSKEFSNIKINELKDNFFEINKSSLSLSQDILSIKIPVELVSEDSLIELLKELKNKKPSSSFKGFYKKYPHSNGYIHFSRIAFTQDTSQALVNMVVVKGFKSGKGMFILLNKDKNKWNIEEVILDWIS